MSKKLASFIFVSILFANTCFSQNKDVFKSYIYTTGSFGLSLKQLLKDTLFQHLPTKNTPFIEVTAQSRPVKNLSFGFCFGYQSFNTEDTRNKGGGNVYIKTTYFNPGIVTAYNFYLSSSFDIYLQTKLNYQINQLEYKLVYPAAQVNSSYKVPMDYPNQFNFQFAAGFNYYFAENLGLHLEGAIGNPYMVKVGINFRFFSSTNKLSTDRKIERVEPIKKKNIYN